jgi:hypothetical protein
MLRSMKDMEDYTIGATDGIIGRVKDLYFDDDAWVSLAHSRQGRNRTAHLPNVKT